MPSQAIAIQHRDEILAQLRQGKMLKEIAAQYGVCKSAIQQPLAQDPEYQQALCDQADSLVEEAKGLTWEAREGLDIARAREISKFAFRYAESINARVWAPRGNQINISSDGPVAVQIVSFSPDAAQQLPNKQATDA